MKELKDMTTKIAEANEVSEAACCAHCKHCRKFETHTYNEDIAAYICLKLVCMTCEMDVCKNYEQE